MSPTARSLREMRGRGYHCAVVEKWNAFAKIRIDLFGFGDILCFKDGESGVTAIQATTSPNISARLKKINENSYVQPWLRCGNNLIVHGWSLKGKKGERKTYELDERPIPISSSLGSTPR